MFKFFTKKIRNRRGFTLIELIVVIAILGILAAIAVPRITGFQDSAKASTNAANVKVIENAAAMYFAEHGAYPAATADVTEMINDYLGGTVPKMQVHKGATVNAVTYTATTATSKFSLNKSSGIVTIIDTIPTTDIEVK